MFQNEGYLNLFMICLNGTYYGILCSSVRPLFTLRSMILSAEFFVSFLGFFFYFFFFEFPIFIFRIIGVFILNSWFSKNMKTDSNQHIHSAYQDTRKPILIKKILIDSTNCIQNYLNSRERIKLKKSQMSFPSLKKWSIISYIYKMFEYTQSK